jgi:hypothetical protein
MNKPVVFKKSFQRPVYLAIDHAREQIHVPEKFDEENLKNFFRTHHFWYNLKQYFESFFKGEAYETNLVPQSKEILKAAFNYYLNFYLLIFHCWTPIKLEMNAIFDWSLKKPGDLLKLVLTKDAIRWTSNDNRAEPQTLYKGYKTLELCIGNDFKDAVNNKKVLMWLRRIEKQTGRKMSDTRRQIDIIDLCIQIARDNNQVDDAEALEKAINNRFDLSLRVLRRQYQ